MLENPASAPPPDPTPVVKRYAPPNQRNRSLNRRKSGDRLDRANIISGNDSEKNQQHATARNSPVIDHGDVVSSNLLNEHYRSHLIPLEGCSRSEASQLLNNRWAEVMHSYNDTSFDRSERPVMHQPITPSAWGTSGYKLPHQLMHPASSVGPASGSQMDFLSELRRAMHNANANF